MKRALALAVVITMAAPSIPFAAPRAQGNATIQGTARSAQGQNLPSYKVQLRSVDSGQLVGSTTSNSAGSFTFTGLNPGNYVVEIVNEAGTIVGTSAAISVAAGAAVSVTVTATAAAIAGAAAGGISTALIVTTVAAGAGIAGAVAIAKNNASPSK